MDDPETAAILLSTFGPLKRQQEAAFKIWRWYRRKAENAIIRKHLRHVADQYHKELVDEAMRDLHRRKMGKKELERQKEREKLSHASRTIQRWIRQWLFRKALAKAIQKTRTQKERLVTVLQRRYRFKLKLRKEIAKYEADTLQKKEEKQRIALELSRKKVEAQVLAQKLLEKRNWAVLVIQRLWKAKKSKRQLKQRAQLVRAAQSQMSRRAQSDLNHIHSQARSLLAKRNSVDSLVMWSKKLPSVDALFLQTILDKRGLHQLDSKGIAMPKAILLPPLKVPAIPL